MKTITLLFGLILTASAQYQPLPGTQYSLSEKIINWKPGMTSGAGTPTGACTQAFDLYVNTTNGHLWVCSAANTWLDTMAYANISGVPAFATCTGDLAGSAPGCTVAKLNGATLSALGTGLLKNTTGTGVPSIAIATDIISLFSSCSGTQYLGADSACHAAAGAGTVTSAGASFTGGLLSVAGSPVTTSGTLAFTVAGTSGGIPYFSGASTWASSLALAANGVMLGGGPGAAPTVTAADSTTTHVLAATAGAPAFRALAAADMPLLTGDITSNSSGVTALSALAIINADIANATIAQAKLDTTTFTAITRKFFGTAAPGSVATNLPGDLYTDTTGHHEYVCNAPSGTAAPACTTVSAAGWLQVDSAGGGSISGLTATKIPKALTSTTIGDSNLAENADGSDNAAKALTWAAATKPTFTVGGTTTCDFSQSNLCEIDFGAGNTTLALSNPHGSGPYLLRSCQDATGGRTYTFPATAKGFSQPDAAAGVTNCTEQSFSYDGTNYQGGATTVPLSAWHGVGAPEGTAPSGLTGTDFLYADSTAHRWKAINNNGAATNVTLASDLDANAIKNAVYCPDTGVANAIACVTATTYPAYAVGQYVLVKIAVNNTGATTIAINGLTATAVTKNGAAVLQAANLVTGQEYLMQYDGTRFQLLNPTLLSLDITNLFGGCSGGQPLGFDGVCHPTPQKFSGTAAPGSVATNLPGDLYTDTTNHHEYVCNAPAATAAPSCTSVSAAGWLQLDSVGGGITSVFGNTGPTVGAVGDLSAVGVVIANAIGSGKMAVVNTRRVCTVDNDTQSATALVVAQFSGACFIAAASHIVEIDVVGGTGVLTGSAAAPTVSGTSSIAVGKWTPNGGTSTTTLFTSGPLAAVAGKACALPTAGSATCGIMGVTQAATISISTTALAAGDMLYVSAATPDATQTWFRTTIIYTVD